MRRVCSIVYSVSKRETLYMSLQMPMTSDLTQMIACDITGTEINARQVQRKFTIAKFIVDKIVIGVKEKMKYHTALSASKAFS